MPLKLKRILITAGPTWVAIDKVRIISNIATGETGILLARRMQGLGAKVTLLLGPAQIEPDYLSSKIRLKRFCFFDELRKRILFELRTNRYDFVIHSAAVADFKPQMQPQGKIGSGKKINLKLTPLPKIYLDIKKHAKGSKLIMFKLEVSASDRALIERAKASLVYSGADIVVANRLNPYRAFIINNGKKIVSVRNKNELARKLTQAIASLTN